MINWQIKNELKKFLLNCKNNKILDFGCGDARYKKFTEENNEYIGVDSKTTGFENSKKNTDIYWDNQTLPFENETSAISNLRSWHYMWSMFYFYKKNFSYTYALKKTYILLIKDFIILLSSMLTFDFKNIKLRFYRLYGLVSSMICLKSFLRP